VWIGQIDKQTWQTQQTKSLSNIKSKQQVISTPFDRFKEANKIGFYLKKTSEMIYVQMSEAKSANMSINVSWPFCFRFALALNINRLV